MIIIIITKIQRERKERQIYNTMFNVVDLQPYKSDDVNYSGQNIMSEGGGCREVRLYRVSMFLSSVHEIKAMRVNLIHRMKDEYQRKTEINQQVSNYIAFLLSTSPMVTTIKHASPRLTV